MPLFVKARSFLRNLFLSRRVDADLDQEVRAHLEMLIDENIRAGMPSREILSLDQSWNEATRSRNQAMGAGFLGYLSSIGSIVGRFACRSL